MARFHKGYDIERIMAIDVFDAARLTVDNVRRMIDLGYFDAPASYGHHLNVRGGLFVHSVNVARRLIQETNLRGGMDDGNPIWRMQSSPARIGLLHDLCKCFMYSVNGRTGGAERERSLWYGHGIVSAMMIPHYLGIFLNEQEIACIAWHMGFSDLTNPDMRGAMGAATKLYGKEIIMTHSADWYASEVMEKDSSGKINLAIEDGGILDTSSVEREEMMCEKNWRDRTVEAERMRECLKVCLAKNGDGDANEEAVAEAKEPAKVEADDVVMMKGAKEAADVGDSYLLKVNGGKPCPLPHFMRHSYIIPNAEKVKANGNTIYRISWNFAHNVFYYMPYHYSNDFDVESAALNKKYGFPMWMYTVEGARYVVDFLNRLRVTEKTFAKTFIDSASNVEVMHFPVSEQMAHIMWEVPDLENVYEIRFDAKTTKGYVFSEVKNDEAFALRCAKCAITCGFPMYAITALEAGHICEELNKRYAPEMEHLRIVIEGEKE